MHAIIIDTAPCQTAATELDTDGQTEQMPQRYADKDQGFVQAGGRQNAVVIRDREEKMPYHQRIIDLLDVV
jgi:type II secretory pathway component GspD/PulD (secretin)